LQIPSAQPKPETVAVPVSVSPPHPAADNPFASLEDDDPATVSPGVRRRRRRQWIGFVIFWVILLCLIGVGVRLVMTGGYLLPAGQVPENRPFARTSEEELVKRFILNNANKDADKVKFLTWGPHMYKAELQGLAEEAGLSLLARHQPEAAKMLQELDAIIRVRYRGPLVPLGPFGGFNRSELAEYDGLYMVIGGKLVVPMGIEKGIDEKRMDDWKKKVRQELSKMFPGVEREP
jgi:hypothetical protein